jgi:citrate synthase
VLDQALALFPLLERANPRSQDLSPLGMARTGADVLRAFCALVLSRPHPVAEPIHKVFGEALQLTPEHEDLVRRLLVLSIDHGRDSATFAVRAVASIGVSPWRLASTGIMVAHGRRTKLGQFSAIGRLIAEIVESRRPTDPITRRIQEGDRVAGFGAPDPEHIDARVQILLDLFESKFATDRDFLRLAAAARAAKEVQGLEPTFALLSAFAWRKVGLMSGTVPFFLARSAGWIAHGIEQYQDTDRERHARRELYYRGPLPAGPKAVAS